MDNNRFNYPNPQQTLATRKPNKSYLLKQGYIKQKKENPFISPQINSKLISTLPRQPLQLKFTYKTSDNSQLKNCQQKLIQQNPIQEQQDKVMINLDKHEEVNRLDIRNSLEKDKAGHNIHQKRSQTNYTSSPDINIQYNKSILSNKVTFINIYKQRMKIMTQRTIYQQITTTQRETRNQVYKTSKKMFDYQYPNNQLINKIYMIIEKIFLYNI